MFKSITKQATDYTAPRANLNQRWRMTLHASGGHDTFGDYWLATCDTTGGWIDNTQMQIYCRDMDTYQHLDPHLQCQPVDIVDRTAYQAGAPTMESYHFGYTIPETPQIAHPYTEERINAAYDWFLTAYPQASRTRVHLYGQSMGAWGCMTYGLRHPERYPAISCTLASWRFKALPDMQMGYASNRPTVPLADGTTYGARQDMVAYVANPANKIPFLSWIVGRQDGYGAFQDHVDAVAALRATKRAFVFAWNNGNHSSATINATQPLIDATYDIGSFELGKGYPVLMNSSADQNPAVDLVGGINLGFKWRNVVETTTGWSCEIANANWACTVDVLPHSDIFTATVAPQHLTLPSNAWVAVSFTASGSDTTAPAAPTSPLDVTMNWS